MKAPSRKRSLPETEVVVHHLLDTDMTSKQANFEAEAVNPTTLVIRRAVRPVEPPPSGSLVVKKIAGNIRRCAGCSRAIKSNAVGFESPDDQLHCLARFERYHLFNRGKNAWHLVTSVRHYRLNPVCTKES